MRLMCESATKYSRDLKLVLSFVQSPETDHTDFLCEDTTTRKIVLPLKTQKLAYIYKNSHTHTQLALRSQLHTTQAEPDQRALGLHTQPHVWRAGFWDANSNHMLALLWSGPLGDFTGDRGEKSGWGSAGVGSPNSLDYTDARASSTDSNLG